MTPSLHQFAGCLLGECLGDALGFAVEGHPPEITKAYVDDILRHNKVMSVARGFPFGQYSDDSQLARELMQSFLDQGAFVPSDYANRIAAIFSESRIVGRGRATQEAANRLTQGVAWDHAGTPAPAAGNGSAMRAGPIGLLFYNDPEARIQAAHDQGRITHTDPRCSAGSVAISGAVALAMNPGTVDVARFSKQLASWVKPFDPILANVLHHSMANWVKLDPNKAVNAIAVVGLEPGYSDEWKGISPFVTTSVLWSLYAFLKYPDSYLEAIYTAIAVGGDVDTTAAMTGAISGAHLGVQGLPSSLVQHVNDQGTWGYEALVALADGCYRLCHT